MENHKHPRFRVTPRDLLTFKKLLECRVMTEQHVETLYYSPGSHTRCSTRLLKFYTAGFLGRLEQPCLLSEGRKPFVYFARLPVVQAIAQAEGRNLDELDWEGKDFTAGYPFVSHLLAVTDVNVLLTKAAPRHQVTIDLWLSDLVLKRKRMIDRVEVIGPTGAKQTTSVVPDAYVEFTAGEHTYRNLLEVDLGSEVGQATTWGQRDISRKVYTYRSYMHSPGNGEPSLYAQRFGAEKGRVLFVTMNERRRDTLKAICEQCGARSRFWLASLPDLQHNDPYVDNVWYRAGSTEPVSLIF